MRKRIADFFLEMIYVLLTAGILFMNVRMLGNTRERIIVGAEIFLLAAAALVILKLKLVLTRTEEVSDDHKDDRFRPVDRAIFDELTNSYKLTGREKEVAWLLYLGYTNRQIADELYIAETTVKKHVTHIFEKSGNTCRDDFRSSIKND